MMPTPYRDMKIPRPPHSWRLTPRRAIALQRELAIRVRRVPPAQEPRFIAGLDAAYADAGKGCVAAVVVWDRAEHRVVEQATAVRPLTFPYVPGLLSFREIPALLAALRRLRRSPDALLCDGQGIAHPRRFGLACHVGILCNLPTIGCAKSILIGTHAELPARRGARTALLDERERIGTVLRTQTGVNPVYVSVGHRIDLRSAERIVLACAVDCRLPEPTRLADRLVAAAKRIGNVERGGAGLHPAAAGPSRR